MPAQGEAALARWAGFALAAFLVATQALAQSNTRLLLSTGWGVPAHQGFAFGTFSGLAMNDSGQVVVLTTMLGSKSELRAVVRSVGVSFDVVAFQGLRAPVPRTTYESFGRPSINNSGQIAFTASLNDGVPISAVVRVEGGSSLAAATTGNAVPGMPDSTFQEFSPPVITTSGNLIFGARLGGKQPASGLFLWTPGGLKSVRLPPEVVLRPSDLLIPAYASHDEAVFVLRGSPPGAVTEQIFRMVASRAFQDLRPVPEDPQVSEVLAPQVGEAPVRLLFVLAEEGEVRTAMILGDPLLAVKAKNTENAPPVALERVQGQTPGPRGNIILAATLKELPSDLALFCFCEGELRRLTSPEEFLPITIPAQGRPISSLTGDGQHTMAFIAPAEVGSDATAIYVVSTP